MVKRQHPQNENGEKGAGNPEVLGANQKHGQAQHRRHKLPQADPAQIPAGQLNHPAETLRAGQSFPYQGNYHSQQITGVGRALEL